MVKHREDELSAEGSHQCSMQCLPRRSARSGGCEVDALEASASLYGIRGASTLDDALGGGGVY